VISGKLRTERARFEKFRAGYLVKCGDPSLRFMQKAEVHVQLKPGMFGVRVRIMPPDAIFPDKIKILETLPPEEKIEEKTEETVAEKEAPQETTESADIIEETEVQETAAKEVEPEKAETEDTEKEVEGEE